MEIESLKAFIAVVEQGSVQRAAARMGTSRATIRRRIEGLELLVGGPLLRRNATGVFATEAGAALLVRARLMVAESKSLTRSIQALAREPRGDLRVVLPVGLATELVGLMAKGLLAPGSSLRVEFEFAVDPVASLLSEVDVALTFREVEAGASWHVEPFLPTPEQLLATPEYLSNNPVRSPADLAGRRLFVWRGSSERPTSLALLDGTQVPIAPVLVSPDVQLIRHLAMKGAGLAYIPNGPILEQAQPGPLVSVLPETVGSQRVLSMVVATALVQSPRINLVRRTLGILADRLTPRGNTRTSPPPVQAGAPMSPNRWPDV